MRYKLKSKITLLIAAIAILVACKTALYVPTTENVTANANIENLLKGRTLYVNKCSSCHTLYLPEKYTKTEWAKWVDRMAPKAKITDQEKELIQAYLTKGE